MTHHCFNQTTSAANRMPVNVPTDGYFHKYGIRVLPTSVTYFIDGVEVAASTEGDALCIPDQYHLILDVETVGTETSDVSTVMAANVSASTFTVDYVHAWDLKHGCPLSADGFFHPRSYGRLESTNRFKIGTGFHGLTAEECMHRCEIVAKCTAVEHLERNGRCFLRSSTTRLQGVRNYTATDVWHSYDRRATRCADQTCLCDSFGFATDAPTLVPATSSPTVAPTSSAPTQSCVDSVANQFTLFQEFTVLREHHRYNIEDDPKVHVQTLDECLRRCVHMGDGTVCLGVQFTDRKDSPICVTKNVRAVAKVDGPGQALTKGNRNFDFYNRDKMCVEAVPANLCVVDHPLNLFAVTPKTRRAMAVTHSKAQSVEDCAARCLVKTLPICLSFSFSRWGGCFLYGNNTEAPLKTKGSHTFYSRNMDSFCDVALGNLEAAEQTGRARRSTSEAEETSVVGVSSSLALVVVGAAIATVFVNARRSTQMESSSSDSPTPTESGELF